MPVAIRAIVRPEKATDVMQALLNAGFPAVTKIDVYGRGKQRGLKIGNVHYDELPKELLMFVVPDEDKDTVIRIILDSARTGTEGAYGDGKIFVTPVEEVYTVSTGVKETAQVLVPSTPETSPRTLVTT
ncbi:MULTISPECIES: P-II family nitrogen regulator [unclassified Roseofilum]|uniref:P-II family nitrogen regulator n=1 Tax=unclassified Roseofilum TaxID=2620099 RepID=UPI000E83BBD5|nr:MULTISPECIES: P-II family nitrogen regulator [unclassified Roseofilum]HBR00975.1 P-II family nitrogen regulator [Cyanobacteria bacterium UBA11691]MBP0008319.1 P-II family nitrogen regulator [Roseofilum sp. Belize Diploria]MBP0013167.1 P-II family nitrogen regulator [Roseofilum sp. SID3]MBP0023256.1 P-II family nitrogen regulator [Roseofilum sp. SID2]MBP0033146.1 P-II family nitrogen regulator [Roseofilum sp. Belize BBD 4]